MALNYPWPYDGSKVWNDGRRATFNPTYFYPFYPWPNGGELGAYKFQISGDGEDILIRDIPEQTYSISPVGTDFFNPYALKIFDLPTRLACALTETGIPSLPGDEEEENSYWPDGVFQHYYFPGSTHLFKFFVGITSTGGNRIFRCEAPSFVAESENPDLSSPVLFMPGEAQKIGFWIYSNKAIDSGKLQLSFSPKDFGGNLRYLNGQTELSAAYTFTVNTAIVINTWTFIEVPLTNKGIYVVGEFGYPHYVRQDGTEAPGFYYEAFELSWNGLISTSTTFYITGGRLMDFSAPLDGSPIWGDGGCSGLIDVDRGPNSRVDFELTSDKLELDSLLKGATSTNDILTKITAEWLADYFNAEPQITTFKNNISSLGLREETIPFFTFNSEAPVKNVLEFWGKRKSNYWQTAKCKVFLHGLQLLPFDSVVFRLSDISHFDFNIIGVVTSVTYDPSDFSTELEIQLGVKTGQRQNSPDYWREHSVTEPTFAE
jgi:hypothetical protein